MKKNFIHIFLLFLVIACTEEVDETPRPREPVQPEQFSPSGEYSYLALGDSYTIGQGVAENDRFPVQVNKALMSEGFDMKPVKIIARTGWRTSALLSAIANENLSKNYDLVTLLIGVNDQYGGGTAQQFRNQFKSVLQTSIELAGNKTHRVIVLSIPDYSVTPFASGLNRKRIADEIDEFNAIKKEEAEKAGVNYIDITEISRKAMNDNGLIASDNLHPSGKMYKQWTDLIVTKAVFVLKN